MMSGVSPSCTIDATPAAHRTSQVRDPQLEPHTTDVYAALGSDLCDCLFHCTCAASAAEYQSVAKALLM